VDISGCGFLTVPNVIISIEGSTDNWKTNGTSSVYSTTTLKFRVYLGYETWITVDAAKDGLWNIEWIAIGLTSPDEADINLLNWEEANSPSNDSRVCSGTTGRTTTNWRNYETDGVFVDVDISGCGFLTVPTVTTSLEGSGENDWKVIGTSAVVSATNTHFQVYIGEGTWIRSDQAKTNLWNIEWIAIGLARDATPSPTYACVDTYDYCASVPLVQGCYNRDYDTRLHFRNDCPLSCGTCYNSTIHPTYLPTQSPTISPTGAALPTCADHVGYCHLILDSCSSNHTDTLVKMRSHCSLSCGFCSQDPTRSPTNAPTRDPSAYSSGHNDSGRTNVPTRNPSTYSSGNNDSGRTNAPTRNPSAYSSGHNDSRRTMDRTIYTVCISIVALLMIICLFNIFYVKRNIKNLKTRLTMIEIPVVDPKVNESEMLPDDLGFNDSEEGTEGVLPTGQGDTRV